MLINHLEKQFGVHNAAWRWLWSYLTGRKAVCEVQRLWCPTKINLWSSAVHSVYVTSQKPAQFYCVAYHKSADECNFWSHSTLQLLFNAVWFLRNGLWLCLVATVPSDHTARNSLPILSQVKSLGMIIDSQLHFDSHAGAIVTARNCCWFLSQIWYCLHYSSDKALQNTSSAKWRSVTSNLRTSQQLGQSNVSSFAS